MHWLIAAITTGTIAFAATNVDDIFILMLFFGGAGQDSRRWRVVAGQYLGFSALVAVSLFGYFARLVVPRAWIGLLGLVPIIIGVKKMFEWRGVRDGRSVKKNNTSVLTVAAVTFANGGDNIGIYTPLFAASDLAPMLVMLAVFLALVAVWCVAGYSLGSHPAVSGVLDRYGHLIVPFVLIGLGLYIMHESRTFQLIR
jgi:cadmium resistance transport/sequestration family protein